MSFADRVRDYQSRVETALDSWLPPAAAEPRRLHEAMRYAILGAGKRIRPILVYASGEAFSVPAAALDGPAVAVEMIHGYSLIHDDLPAMDDDDLRRGRPTCHKAFDEATAILAGDALQALAFHVLAHDGGMPIGAAQRVRMIDTLAIASGSLGMAGGQAIDLAAVGRSLGLAELENMHRHKTGALIRACVELGALCCPDLEPGALERLSTYAQKIGLAFQIQDDILDVEGNTDTLGKRAGADAERVKPTYPSVLGLEAARVQALARRDRAIAALAPWGARYANLREFAGFLVSRAS
ncbi:MAG TPA: farnesyl diphosphate synthase [Gammaproteobacteria bacterium]